MDESQQIIYMQARILRPASKEWGMSIRECFDLFHTEGDLTLLEDVMDHLGYMYISNSRR